MIKIFKKSYLNGQLLISSCSKFSSFTEEDIKKAEKYVIQNLRSRSWVDYYLSGYMPSSIRTAYCTLLLFNLQLIRIVDNVREPSLGLGKLQFWRSSINKIYRSQKPNAQPISICLYNACHNNPLTKGYFNRIIDAKAEEISSRNIDTIGQMLVLSQKSYSTLIALTLQLMRIEIQKQHEQLLTKLGQSIGICMFLRRVPHGLRNYKFLVPLDIMSKHNVQTAKIWDRIKGKPSQQFFDAVLEISAYSKKSFQDSVVIYENLMKENKINPQAFRAFLKGVEIEQYLKLLQKHNFNLFEPALNKGIASIPLKLFKASRNKKFYTTGKIQ